MKYNIKKIISVILIIMLVVSTCVIAEDENFIKKDETVYVSLESNGNVKSIVVVNRLFDIIGHEIYDSGDYESVKSLSDNIPPILNGSNIIWYREDDMEKDFYYEGYIDKELPINFEINYILDGKQISGEDIAGKSGELKIEFEVKQNKTISEDRMNAYLTQIQIPLDLNKIKIIDFSKAMKVVSGTNATISYSVLPDTDANFSLILDVKDFEMKSIQISLISYDAIISDEYDELIDGMEKMEDGMEEINNGTDELEDGLSDLVDGVGELKDGLTKLNVGGQGLDEGLKEYQSGLKEFNDGIGAASDGLNDATEALNQLNQNSDQIISGYNDLYLGLEQLQNGHEQLVLIAQSLLQSTDPNMRALGQGVIEENESLKFLLAGLSQANIGLSEYCINLGVVFNGISEINDGIIVLSEGSTALTLAYDEMVAQSDDFFIGLDTSASGTVDMYNSIKYIPQDVQKLSEGQIKIGNGITEMKEGFEGNYDSSKSENIYSFVNKDNIINSIQFIMITPEIKAEELVDDNKIVLEELDDVWYKKIWMMVKNLFE